MARRRSELLTDVELEFMIALWSIGSGSVRDIMSTLQGGTKRAYTSVATIMKILDDKGYVTSERQARSLVYVPAIQKDEYEGRSLKNLSDSLFGGTPTALVARLVDNEDLTDEMIREIKEIIDTRIRKDDD
ncbi:BlaI/MecI/CopY family transcriptional regulator [Aliiroseovarius sp. M344]|uniref:BlaI/MecI/CopY family transcriptional regulator n=1 Tax=Aliiroseovarius sp. M344 TaxID=2867010 RepID=UPI0021AD7B5F|nr:BlaI/MecI/CopY family transcriptional regulator [Aliiroseovarius sp. M344]UWQ14206.1 BlaI/MecI/CopY family transcriptional regulator [Aliiroseovarius sp. M344]